jgi:hypothetical protein
MLTHSRFSGTCRIMKETYNTARAMARQEALQKTIDTKFLAKVEKKLKPNTEIILHTGDRFLPHQAPCNIVSASIKATNTNGKTVYQTITHGRLSTYGRFKRQILKLAKKLEKSQ